MAYEFDDKFYAEFNTDDSRVEEPQQSVFVYTFPDRFLYKYITYHSDSKIMTVYLNQRNGWLPKLSRGNMIIPMAQAPICNRTVTIVESTPGHCKLHSNPDIKNYPHVHIQLDAPLSAEDLKLMLKILYYYERNDTRYSSLTLRAICNQSPEFSDCEGLPIITPEIMHKMESEFNNYLDNPFGEEYMQPVQCPRFDFATPIALILGFFIMFLCARYFRRR